MHYILLLSLSFFSFSVLAGVFPDTPYISVVGHALLEIKADQVIIKFQPSALDNSGTQAKQQVDEKITLLIKELTLSGFKSEPLKTLNQSIRPEYKYEKNKRVFQGVRATHQLSYRLTDLNKTDIFIDVLLRVKIESISALQYGLKNPQQWQEKVRKIAVLDSQQKAHDLALLYGAKLGKVYSINYENQNVDVFQPRMMALEMKSDMTQIKPKKITLKDRVKTVFILQP